MEGVKSQKTRRHERAGIDMIAETEIEEEFFAIMESVKSEDMTICETKPTVVTVDYKVQRSEESSSELIAQSNDDVSILSLRCRLCATPNKDMIDIFRSNESTEDITKMIKHSLPIAVQETDTLPKQACRFCLEKLELCFQFQRTVIEAEKLLLAFDSEARIKREQMERNYHTCSPRRILEHDDIERTSGTVLDEEIDNNQSTTTAPEKQTADTNVESNPILTSLKPCSVTLVRTKIYSRNNLDKDGKRNSITDRKQKADLPMDMLNTGRASLSHVKKHLCRWKQRIDISKRRHKCDLCIKSFKSKHGLNRHYVLHTGKGLYKCKYCKKSFTDRSERNRHHRVHTNERPYECANCPKRYKDGTGLRRHVIGHSNKRN